ncbi:MAG: c-type heme family protein [Gammaproteobacteria bacterium]
MTSKRISIFAGLWLIVIGVSYYEQVVDDRRYAEKVAYKQAEMFFEHIVLIRQWNALHGGVYVFVTENDQPNPAIKIADRDFSLADGRSLTLFNPTYMTRQLAKMERDKTGILFHTTSLQPISPLNRPDSWEIMALADFKKGVRSRKELAFIDGQAYYR